MIQRYLAAALVSLGLAAAQPSLKETFQPYFRIGAALNPGHFQETDATGTAVVKKHFNSVTAENVMKWGPIHPLPDKYNFEPADRFVEFGEKNGMFIVGHTLVWHSQTPRWVFEDAEGKPLDREGLLKRMREHIFTVVGRYRGRVHAWDVVNEALNEDGSMRKSPWFNIIGDDYVAKAFEYVKEADPQAALYYNDYSLENEAKRNGAVALVKRLQAQGIKVAAIGTQQHNRLEWPTVEQMDATFAAFKQLGVKIAVTELDVDVLPRAVRSPTADVSVRATATPELNPYTAGLPDEVQGTLAKRYFEIFNVYLKHHDAIDRITFWGVSDRVSWLNNFPVRGRTNHPLLFDREEKPKPAFDWVIRSASMYETNQRTGQDHQRMMEQLGIQSLRRGASGNPNAPNAANYDESKATTYSKLPDPLVLNNGRKVTAAAQWWKLRRPEIVEHFDREVYGRMPKQMPKVRWEVTETAEDKVGNIPVIRKTLLGHVDNSAYPQVTVDIQLTLTTPAAATRPVPVIMELSFGRFPRMPGAPSFPAPAWPQEVLARGWGYAILVPTSIQPDNGAGLAQGIIGLANKGSAAQTRRLGRAAGVGVGRKPRTRLFRNRQSRGRQAGGHHGTLALWQSVRGRDGVRPAVCDRLHQFIRRRRFETAPPQLRGVG
jgi:endo-1,4-beta-xylanase